MRVRVRVRGGVRVRVRARHTIALRGRDLMRAQPPAREEEHMYACRMHIPCRYSAYAMHVRVPPAREEERVQPGIVEQRLRVPQLV